MKLKTLALALAVALCAPLLRAETPQSVQYYQYGVRYYQARQYDQALKYFAASLKLDNRQATVYQAVGNCYYAKGDKTRALQYYNYALRLNPSNQSLQQFVARLGAPTAPQAQDALARGHQLYRAQRYSEALEAYKQAAAVQPNNARVYQSLGNSFYALQDRTHAIENWRKAVELDPGNKPLADFLAKIDDKGSVMADAGGGSWGQPLWRSMILPGWGQYYNGESGKAWLLGGTTMALFAGELGTFLVGDAARQQYLSLSDPKADYDTPYSTWETMANLNHIFFWGMTAAYTYTAVDAVMNSGKHRQLAAAEPPAMNLALVPGGAKLSLRVLEF